MTPWSIDEGWVEKDGVNASFPLKICRSRCLLAEGTKLDEILGHHHHLKWLLNRATTKKRKEKKRNQKIQRLANFLHSYILTQIWSILWCIIENHLKDSEKLLLVCLKKKKIDDFDFYLTMKKEHLSLLCSLLRFDMKQSCLSVVCEPESALSL